MPQGETLAVRGLSELVRDFRRISKDLGKELRAELLKVAEPVAVDARSRAARYGAKTVRGIRPGIRGSTAVVRQGNRKTTGNRPDFGALQMRGVLIPALMDNQAEIEKGMEKMLDRITRETT